MTYLLSILGLSILFLSCLGAGAAVLASIRLWERLSQAERFAISFALGFGLVGWLYFWLGIFGAIDREVAWAIGIIMSSGLWLFRRPAKKPNILYDQSSYMIFGLLLLGTIASLDIFEALAPPVDADTLAYHFDLPKNFSEAGSIYFVPRALDGAIPQLVHMTYLAALQLGPVSQSDLMLTGWTAISSWAVGFFTYVLCLRWMSSVWAIYVVVVFLTIPAVIFGAGTGQVEVKIALFTLLAFSAFIIGNTMDELGPTILLGLAAGFFAASKLTGLLFLPAAGIGLICLCRRTIFHGTIFAGVVLIAGIQWYAWNYFHTGDPIFPMLYEVLNIPDSEIWSRDHSRNLADVLENRSRPLDNPLVFLFFPILITLAPIPAFESGRVGVGPIFLLVAPMVFWTVWRYRDRIISSSLTPIILTTVIFYVLWLIFGSVPKVRHLVPILPLILISFFAIVLTKKSKEVIVPCAIAIAITIGIQFSGLAIFSNQYVTRVFSNQSSKDFLLRTIGEDYKIVEWINDNNDKIGKVLTFERHLLYYIKVPHILVHPDVYSRIDTRPGHVTPDILLSQLKNLDVSHVIFQDPKTLTPRSFAMSAHQLSARGCLSKIRSFHSQRFTSRTLKVPGEEGMRKTIMQVDYDDCR